MLAAFLLCEIAARMILPAPPDRTRQPPVAYLYDPEIRYVLAPSQQGWIEDGLVTVNSAGFRGSDIALPKPAGRFRIAVLGDSVTIGMGVADEEAYPAQLERLLHTRFPGRDLDVVNLGVPGYDTRQEVGLLRRNLSRLMPDMVLVGFYTNDVPDVLEGEATLQGTQVADRNPRAGQVLHMDATSPSFVDRYLRRSRVIFVLGRAFNRWRGAGEWGMARMALEMDLLEGKPSVELDRAWARVAGQFQELRELAESTPFIVGVVILPPRELVTGQFAAAPYVNKVKSLAEPLNFAIIDPTPAMTATRADAVGLFIPYDRNHPSAAGHRVIAQAIFDQVAPRVADPATR
jgi:lysophospholipase L1-like esterase